MCMVCAMSTHTRAPRRSTRRARLIWPFRLLFTLLCGCRVRSDRFSTAQLRLAESPDQPSIDLWNVVWSGTTIRVHAGPGDQITADAVRRVNTLTREMLRSTDRAIPEIKLDLVQDTQTQTRSALGRPGCAPDPALA